MKSIKLKVMLSILGVTILVIGCTWVFQVLLLEYNYLEGKEQDMLASAERIVDMIEDNKGNISQLPLTVVAGQNNLCIEFFDPHSGASLQFTPRGSSNLLQDPNLERVALLAFLQSQNTGQYLTQTHLSEYGREFTVIATNQEVNGGEYILMVASELAPIQEAVSSIQTQLIFLTVALLTLAGIAAIILSRYLTKSIVKISQAAREVAKGNLEVSVSVRSADELGMLSNDFNVMVDGIRRSSQFQRELIANVSHDFRTPLTMIKGYAEMIRDLTGDIPDKRNQQLNIIMEESDRLNTLANDILDLSKLQAGQQELTITSFDLGVKLQDILGRFQLLTDSEQFQLSLEAPEHVFVTADEVKIEQVLYNILNNAVNHTGADKKVFLTLEEYENHVWVGIRDTGTGIDPKDAPLIWDRYYKPYKKDDRKGMGTGLGLSIVKAILQAHNAPFGVDSAIGAGSTFWFELEKAPEMPPSLPPSV